MLDPRIYRASLIPVLLALLVVAFALQDRPRPIGTTYAPDAFSGAAAGALLDDLAQAYPDRRPGSPGDEALSRRVADELRRALQPGGVRTSSVVSLQRLRGRTIDGPQDLVNVIATRPGRPGPGLVVVGHRDAAAHGAKAELSGTAALIELARIAGSGRLRRTITFVSTSGGSGGAAGARAAVARLQARPDAVLVLGDMASKRTHKPYVVPFSGGRGVAPVRLRRTVEAAARQETGTDPGGYRAGTQWVRQAFPVTVSEQGALGAAGLPAVLLSASGERGPAPGATVSRHRLQTFGRTALRVIFALDNGPTVGGGPAPVLQTARKILSVRAIRLLGGALMLPVLLVTIDGFARARRRREPVGRRVLWVLGSALPFVLAGMAAIVLVLVSLIDPAPRLAVPDRALVLNGAAAAAAATLLIVFALGWVLRPVLLRLAGIHAGTDPTPAPAVALLLVLGITAVAVWVLNPFAAVLLAPAMHLWLLAVSPDWRWPRPVRVAAVLAGLLPFAVAARMDLGALDYTVAQGAWQGVLLVGGGGVGLLTWLLWALVAGCASAALVVALHPPQEPVDRSLPTERPTTSVRGPGGYIGPGSLGGVSSGPGRR